MFGYELLGFKVGIVHDRRQFLQSRRGERHIRFQFFERKAFRHFHFRRRCLIGKVGRLSASFSSRRWSRLRFGSGFERGRGDRGNGSFSGGIFFRGFVHSVFPQNGFAVAYDQIRQIGGSFAGLLQHFLAGGPATHKFIGPVKLAGKFSSSAGVVDKGKKCRVGTFL